MLFGPYKTMVPGPAGPGDVSNNNLDLTWHDDRLWMAYRSAPIHFASPDARIVVVSSPDLGATWRQESEIRPGRDLREPRFYVASGRLHLTWFTAGTKRMAFEPDRVWVSRLDHDDCWTEPIAVGPPDTVVWRVREIAGTLTMSVYRHAGTLFTRHPQPLEVEFWTSTDGLEWHRSGEVIHRGGSETEILELPDGRVLGVTRKEGPHQGWGADIGIVDATRIHDPAAWSWRPDPRKLDSPLLFLDGGDPYLVTRRQVAFSGRYDQGWRHFSPNVRTRLYQALYSVTPKRTVVYRIDPDTRRLHEIGDLPSAGDTAFGAEVALPGGGHLLANYTSDPIHAWWPWFVGQIRPTSIYLLEASAS